MASKKWTIQERLHAEWTSELVGYPWNDPRRPAVTDADGKTLTVQVSGGKAWFVVERLTALSQVSYRAEAAHTPDAGPCATVREDAGAVVLSNGVVAIRVPASVSPGAAAGDRDLPAPLQALRWGEGPWIGAGRLHTSPDQTITDIRFHIVEEGPLWCTYAVTYVADEHDYRIDYRLDAGAP